MEEICEQEGGDDSIAEMAKDEMSSANIRRRVQERLQEALGPSSWDQTCLASTVSLENSKLVKELDETKELLSESRKGCHELAINMLDKVDSPC